MTSLLRPEDVARTLGVSRQTIYNLAKAGALRAVIFKTRGDRWTYRFRHEDVDAFIGGHLREGRAG
jgi:excisionase family DNA binding protein